MRGASEDRPLEGRVAVVTGAARGLGRAVACALHARGARVGLLDLDEAEASQAAAALGADAVAAECDVGHAASVVTALHEVEQALGVPDVLVNNAGVGGPFHSLDEVSDGEWERLVATNLKSVFLLCRALLPKMRAKAFGRVVNIASIQGFLGAARSSTYVATKHGMLGYTRAIAAEWGPFGITCNALCPGYLVTRQGIQEAAAADHEARVLARTPVGRLGTPSELAELVAFLVGPHGGYLNGAVIAADGGISADLGLT